jgi:hypothetical protein
LDWSTQKIRGSRMRGWRGRFKNNRVEHSRVLQRKKQNAREYSQVSNFVLNAEVGYLFIHNLSP